MTDHYASGRTAGIRDAAELAKKLADSGNDFVGQDYYDAIIDLQVQDPKPGGVTLGNLRPIWRKHGGDWHGPRVETWTIPEDNVKAAFTEILSAITPAPVTPQEARKEGYIQGLEDAMRLCNTIDPGDRPDWADAESWTHCAEVYAIQIAAIAWKEKSK